MTTSTRTPLIAGNWKMNLDHFEALTLIQKLSWALRDLSVDLSAIEVALLPPFTDLRSAQTLIQGERMTLTYGAQDVSPHDAGAYTGEVSAAFLARLGCTYAIVGHSERRAHHGEDDALVSAKLRAALRHDLTPILCVGEPLEVRSAGDHVAHVLAQLDGALAGTQEDGLGGLVVAYEPVWAIGTGETAGPEDAQEMAAAIRTRIAQTHGDGPAAATRILYGGSVTADNAADLVSGADVDGALVGGASLDPTGFAALIHAVHRVD